MRSTNDPYRSYRTASQAFSLTAMSLASLALIGWSFEIPTLTSLLPGLPGMKATTAFGLFFCGASVLWLNATAPGTKTFRQSRYIQPALPAGIGGLLGLGTLIGYAAGIVPTTAHPAWMSPDAAVLLLFFALAVVTFQSEKRALQWISEAAVLFVLWISVLHFVGYLYNSKSLYTFRPSVPTSLPTVLTFILLGLSFLCVRPDRGVMAIYLSQETGGLLLRRLVPLTLGMVILVGCFRLAGEITGTFVHMSSLTAVVALSIAGYGVVLGIVVRYLNRVENQWNETRIRLQLAKEAADLGIHDYDMVRGTIQWDERVRELWNVGPRQPITMETFWTAVHLEDRASTKAAVDLALDPSGNGRYAVEFRTIPGAEGEPRWIEARGRTIFERGRAVRLVGTVQDITERKQGEAELREAHERLRRWNADLEQAVNVKTAELIQSQERLRALASELSLTEQRERTRLATELHDHLQQLLVLGKLEIGQGKRFAVGSPACEKVMKRVDDILSDSLTYSRTLVAELSPPVLRDHGLAAGLKWLAEYMSKRHEQTVTVLVPEEDLRLPEDQRILLFQSVRELLINSSKYAGTGEAAVEMIQSENQVRIEVRDQGAGFDLTADASAVGTPSGGISSKFGLFSIRERMHALGGSCVIESAPGQGTRATLRLPLAQSGQKTVESEQWGMPGGEGVQSGEGAKRSPFKDSPPATHHSTLQKNGLIRVLLVDDHAMVRQGLRSVLDAYADVQVVGEAQDGSEAVRLAEELRPRVVVMDINMPMLNGIEATERIKTQWPGTVVIGISVNTGDANGQAMKQAGAAGLIAKDAAVDELYALIRRETTDAAQFEVSEKAR